MIGKLKGIVDSIAADHAIGDVNGVGYVVHAPSSTLSHLSIGVAASLAIETRVGEDSIRLYGFSTADEREWFRLLQTVQNVGARVALNVLSALSVRDIERAVALGNKGVVARAQGVGPKLAARIVAELKDKVPSVMLSGRAGDGTMTAISPRGPEADAVSALLKLGYTQTQAAEAVARATRDLGSAAADRLIRESLRAMAR